MLWLSNGPETLLEIFRKEVMYKTLEYCEKLYEEIKNFFYDKDQYDFVIEMSDRPMGEWKLIYVLSHQQMSVERIRISKLGTGFAGFMGFENQYYFYFSNKVLFKTQILDTGEIVEYDDRTFNEIDMKKVIKELKQLQGS
jgi:hypothetical protein